MMAFYTLSLFCTWKRPGCFQVGFCSMGITGVHPWLQGSPCAHCNCVHICSGELTSKKANKTCRVWAQPWIFKASLLLGWGKGCTAPWSWWGLQVFASWWSCAWSYPGVRTPVLAPSPAKAPFHSQPFPSFPSGCSLSLLFSSGAAIFPG